MSLPFTDRNLDLVDTHNIKDVWEHNGVIYSSREAKMMSEQKTEKEHTPSLLAAAVIGLNNTAEPSRSTSKLETMWTDIDAQEMYLRAKPTCYIILGKSGLGAYGLGEAISKKYNCIHLCPLNIMSDEISQESLSGKCLNFNLKHNVPCTHTTILKMLIQKVKSPAVKHRGYVISGIPIVNAYKTPNVLIKSKYTEEALLIIDQILFDVIYNLKRKKPKSQAIPSGTESTQSSLKNAEEGELEEEQIIEEQEALHEDEEQAIVAELPKFLLNSCLNIFHRRKKTFFNTQQVILLQQLQEVFKLSLKPDIIIYITCPDGDVLTKKTHKFINYKNNQYITEPFPTINTSDLRWPAKYTSSDYENPHNIHVFNSKYCCRPPINFKKKSVVQVCNYRHYILPFIEKKIMNYDPKQVIKLDGRTSTYQMMHQITERLVLMHINPVIIPEPLYLQEPSDDLEEFWNMIQESHVIKHGALNFTCYPSLWYNRCPVELKKRQSVIGKPVLAVKLFKHVYLMSSLNNFVSFCRNPRPFLKLKYLEPTCRIIVTGTRWSGKTMVAECLSWIFDTPVIDFMSFLETEKQKKYDVFAVRIFSEISGTIEDARIMQWKTEENNRILGLDEWWKLVLGQLKKYLPILIKYTKLDELIKEERERKRQEEIAEQKDLKDQETDVEKIDSGEQEKDADVEKPPSKSEQQKGADTEKRAPKKSPTKKGEKTKKEAKIKEPAKKIEMDPDLLKIYNDYRERLSFLPILDSIPECEAVLADPSILLTYAPLELTTITEEPKVPVLGDVDVTKAISEYIVANDLQKDIEPTTEELMDELIQQISPMDIKSSEFSVTESYRKYIIDGFPSDPEYWDFLSNAKVIPDYTISIMENREIEPDLVQHYTNIKNSFKNYHEILSSVKDPLIISKLQTKSLPFRQVTHNNIKIIIHDLINDSLETQDQPDVTQESDNTEFIKQIEESMEKFRENWDNIKIRLEDISKCYIEIELRDKTDVEVLEEALLKLREGYCIIGQVNEGEENEADENDGAKDLLTYNDSQNLCETNIYCPLTYFNNGLLWEGKREFSLTFNNKVHYFAKEEYVELFQQDITKYQSYIKPFKKMPKLKICVTGSIGSGKTALSKQLALELGLLHVDFQDVINNYYMPQHYKKVGRMYENPFTDEIEEEEGVVEFHFDEENPIGYDDIVSNEVELRRMLYNYFERAQPVNPVYMQKIITKIWNDYPYINTGFVLDGYPRIPQDGEDMIQVNCIPDLVIALDCDLDTSLKRLAPIMFDRWKSQLTQAKIAHRVKVDDEHKEWLRFITKVVAVEAILDEMLENLIVENPQSLGRDPSGQSVIMDADPLGSVNVNPHVFNAYNKMIELYPEPKDTREWEKPLEQLENINGRIEAIQESDNEARRVPVPDERFDYLCEYHKPASKVPAFLNVVDIAGLVRGAAEGQGLGNAFLSHIKACDAIFNLCRAFDDEDVIHVDGDVNPVRDLETIGEELRLKDEEQLMQNIEKLDRVVNRGNDKKLKPEYDTLLKIKTVLVDEKKHIRFGDWSAADIEILNKYLFLTSKPALYLVNLSEKDYIRKKNKWLPKLKEWIDKNDPGAPLIPFSGALEMKLVEMDPQERQAFLKENNLTSALDKIIVQGYKALQLEYFFTAGPDEVKAWTIQKGTKAPQAAGRIHTDFEKGFIMAEVMHYKDFKEEGTEAACKAAGKYRQQGRNYVVEDGDIIFFKFNAGAGLKDAKKK